jgi:hypothetical protein
MMLEKPDVSATASNQHEGFSRSSICDSASNTLIPAFWSGPDFRTAPGPVGRRIFLLIIAAFSFSLFNLKVNSMDQSPLPRVAMFSRRIKTK